MAAIQLNFNLRTSSKCKTVHLVGSWDNYKSNLPLNKDSSKSGGWKGTFRFSTPTLLPGQRYWYYYIIDGYHVSHDPARESCTEPTTGRKLNILDIPAPNGGGGGGGGGGSGYKTQTMQPSRGSRQHMAAGRSLSPSQIQHPHPSRPYETQVFRSAEMEALSRRYAAHRIDTNSSDTDSSESDFSSDVPSLSSRSSHSSSPSSVSSLGSGSPVMGSTAAFMGGMRGSGCTCERYAVTKSGQKVKLDCGGKVCASDASSGSSSDDDTSDSSSDSEPDRRHHHRSSKHRSSRKHSSHHKSSAKSSKRGLKVRR